MRRRKENILLNLLLGTGAYLLYSKRHQLGDIGDLRDRARESYETASRRIGRASDALRGKDHAVVRTATASLMGVGVGVGIGMLLAPASGQKTRADISEKVKDVREKVRDRLRCAASLLEEQQVAVARRDVEASVRDVVREHDAVGERHERIVVTADDERR